MKQTPQCRGSVHDDFGVGFHQCMSKASVTRNGKPYCKLHDPLRVEKRTEARHRKWQQEWTAKAETQRKAENARKSTECKARIGAELAKAVLVCFGFVTADGPTRIGATKEEVLALLALAREFQKQGGG